MSFVYDALIPVFAVSFKNEQTLIASGDIDWSAPSAGSQVVYTAPGLFALPAGHTYLLTANIVLLGGESYTTYQWVTSDDVPIGETFTSINTNEHVHVTTVVVGGGLQVKLVCPYVNDFVTIGQNSVLNIQIME